METLLSPEEAGISSFYKGIQFLSRKPNKEEKTGKNQENPRKTKRKS